jgi:hypothetical protein
LGPIKPVMLPWATSKDTSFTACKPPKDLETFSIRIKVGAPASRLFLKLWWSGQRWPLGRLAQCEDSIAEHEAYQGDEQTGFKRSSQGRRRAPMTVNDARQLDHRCSSYSS